MAHTINWEPKGVYAKFVGTCDFDDVQHAFEQISGDFRCNYIRYGIFDYLDVERHNVTKWGAVKAAAFDKGFAYYFPSIRFASVATDGQALELWQHFVDVVKIPGRHGLFPTVSAARDWLAVG